jgi:hypothetical protein
MVDEKLRQLKAEQAEVDESSEVTAGLLSYLLSTDMPLGEVYANISELMLGAVDTVIWLTSMCDLRDVRRVTAFHSCIRVA